MNKRENFKKNYHKYRDEGLSLVKIAQIYEVGATTIRKWAMQDGFDTRPINQQFYKNFDIQVDETSIHMLQNQNEKLKKELEKEKAKTNILIETVKEFIPRIPALKLPKRNKIEYVDYDEETIVVVISDSQIGQKIESEEVSGLNEYNFEIFKERAKILIDSILKIIRMHKQMHPVKKVVFLFLGDIVEGDCIYKGQSFHIDLVSVDQVFKSIPIWQMILLEVLKEVPDIEIFSVPGNHGRVGFKGQHHEKVNWDYVLMEILRISLINNPAIKFFNNSAPFTIVNINGHIFHISHGDDVKSWAGIPFYGLDRKARKVKDMTGLPIEYFVSAHIHRSATIDNTSNSVIIVNNNWVGGSNLSINRMSSSGLPSQKMFGVHYHRGKTWERDIVLADKKELIMNENNIYIASGMDNLK